MEQNISEENPTTLQKFYEKSNLLENELNKQLYFSLNTTAGQSKKKVYHFINHAITEPLKLQPQQSTQEFIPFLQERDKLGRLLNTVTEDNLSNSKRLGRSSTAKKSLFVNGKYFRNITRESFGTAPNESAPMYQRYFQQMQKEVQMKPSTANTPGQLFKSSFVEISQKSDRHHHKFLSRNLTSAYTSTADTLLTRGFKQVSSSPMKSELERPISQEVINQFSDQPSALSNQNVESRITFCDQKTGQPVQVTMPSYEKLSRISSTDFIKSFKSIARKVKSELGKSRAFRVQEPRPERVTKKIQSKIPDPGFYDVKPVIKQFHNPLITQQRSRMQNESRDGGRLLFGLSQDLLNQQSFQQQQQHEQKFKTQDILKPNANLERHVRVLSFDKQISRDKVPIIYNKEIVDMMNRNLVRSEKLTKEAMFNTFDKDDKRVLINPRAMINQPQIFDSDVPKKTRLYFQARFNLLKTSIKNFIPEKGQKFEWATLQQHQQLHQKD